MLDIFRIERGSRKTTAGKSAMVHPQGNSPEFILAVLRAWRERHGGLPAGCAPSAAGRFAAAGAVLPSQNHAGQHGGAARGGVQRRSNSLADAENIVTTMGLRPGLAEPRGDFAFLFLRIFEPGAAAAAARHAAVSGAFAAAGGAAVRGARPLRISRWPPCRRCGTPGTRPARF